MSYLSARQKWMEWWIRIIQKYVSEAIVLGIEAGFAHRARLAGDLITSPYNTLKSPPIMSITRTHNHELTPQEMDHQTVTAPAKPGSDTQKVARATSWETGDTISEYEKTAITK